MCLPRSKVWRHGSRTGGIRYRCRPKPCRGKRFSPRLGSFLIPGQPLPRITSASGKRMPVKGVIVLYLQVWDLRTRVRFYAVTGLGVPCILRCNFIDLHIRSIHPKERQVELREGGPVAISTATRLSGTASAVYREHMPYTKIRIARRTVIPPSTEAHIEVT
jgi:hypothetical protein